MENHVKHSDRVRNAYNRLTTDEIDLFLSLRQLSTDGTGPERVRRLVDHDARVYNFSSSSNETSTLTLSPPPSPLFPPASEAPVVVVPSKASAVVSPGALSSGPSLSSSVVQTSRSISAPDLPVEIIAHILDLIGDWALARAVGLPTSLVSPTEWTRPSQIDSAMLSGYLPLIRAANPAVNAPSKDGVELAIRFGYVHVLDYLRVHARAVFFGTVAASRIPVVASMHGRVLVLQWWAWHVGDDFPVLGGAERASAVDGAASSGHVDVLQWWWAQQARPGWGIFECTEGALEGAGRRGQLAVLDWFRERHVRDGMVLRPGRAVDYASAAGRLDVLSWWARSGLELAYDRGPLRHASVHGRTDVLRWWAESGLQLVYDADVLVGATRHDQPEVLEWWDRSGLTVQYRLCDIEEALEDAIGGGERAREWWRRKGVDFNANDKEWMKVQSLN